VKLGGFNAPTQDVSGACGSARNEAITAWAQGDAGETTCPTPGMLMMVTFYARTRRRRHDGTAKADSWTGTVPHSFAGKRPKVRNEARGLIVDL
jgi:hypothetical protein